MSVEISEPNALCEPTLTVLIVRFSNTLTMELFSSVHPTVVAK